MPDTPPVPPASSRLFSLDALRGSVLFGILGMEAVGAALAQVGKAPWTQFIAEQLDHAAWAKFRVLDLIFPLFIFISGISLVHSTDKNVAAAGRRGAVIRLLKRALLLYFP